MVGNRTGRDGIGGCSILASHEFSEDDAKRPTVQIGDPFTEKCLIEACLEVLQGDAIVGMKDMGAAGITCTTAEMAAAGGVGMDIDLARVPMREEGMEPWEIMMSESQERMLVVAKKGREQEVIAIFEKWNLNAADRRRSHRRSRCCASASTAKWWRKCRANHSPKRPSTICLPKPPAWLAALNAADFSGLPLPDDYTSSAAHAARLAEYRQQTLGLSTIRSHGADQYRGAARAPAMRRSSASKAPNKALGLTTDCNSRYCYLDPYLGAQIAVAEAARNLVCVGADPAAVTDCLNFGKPEKPDRFWQLNARWKASPTPAAPSTCR